MQLSEKVFPLSDLLEYVFKKSFQLHKVTTFILKIVVSTIISGVLFARFRIVVWSDHIKLSLGRHKLLRRKMREKYRSYSVTFLFIIPWFWENSFFHIFEMTVWVTRWTHIVLLGSNVSLGKEGEEKNSPTHQNWTFLLDWNFF